MATTPIKDKVEKTIDLTSASTDDLLKALQSKEINAGILKFDVKVDGAAEVFGNLEKTFKSAINPADIMDGMRTFSHQFDSLTSQLAKSFGVAKENVGDIGHTFAMSYKDVFKMGGDLNDIAKVQQGVMDNFHTNIIASSDNVKELFATQQVTNVEPKKLIEGFRSVGMSMSHIKDEMQKVVDHSYSIGVNVTEVSKRVSENIGKLNLYNFQGGVEGLAKMASQSAMLGINMESTFKVADDLLDPQKAIDLSASLQRLGVTSSQLLDPLRAMDLAQNDPTELQNQMVQLSQQFVRTKEDGNFEILPGAKRQLREVAQALGMSASELSTMALNSADFNKKMSEIRMPSIATEEQKTLIANMSQLNKNTGKYEISLGLDESGKEIKKSIDDLPSNNKDLTEMLERASKEKEKPRMEQLAEKQLSSLDTIANYFKIVGAQGKLEGAAAFGKVITKQEEQVYRDVTQPMLKGRDSEREFKSYYEGGKPGLEHIRKGEDVTVEDMMNLGKIFISEYSNNTMKAAGETYLKLKEVMSNLDFSKFPGYKDMQEGFDKFIKIIQDTSLSSEDITNSITNWSKTMMNHNDFYIDESGVHDFNANDLIIGGINKNTGEIISNDPKEMSKSSVEKNVKTSTEIPTFDLTPLTELMSKFLEKNSSVVETPNKIDFNSIKNLVEMNMDKEKTQSLASKENTFQISKTQEPITSFLSSSTILPKTSMEYQNMLSATIPNNVEQPFKTISPQIKPDKIDSNNLSLPTQISPTQTQKIEFGNLEISLKVDIPNNTNVSTDQVKEVLQTAMNSTEFKQKIVVAINEANTNYGLTSVGGTSNYGSNKTNYSLNT